jgi:hypothetical protein
LASQSRLQIAGQSTRIAELSPSLLICSLCKKQTSLLDINTPSFLPTPTSLFQNLSSHSIRI